MTNILLNYTPHPITIVDADANILRTITSSGLVRLKADTVDAGITVDGVNVTKTVFGDPVGLPDAVDGTYYIVSQLVC